MGTATHGMALPHTVEQGQSRLTDKQIKYSRRVHCGCHAADGPANHILGGTGIAARAGPPPVAAWAQLARAFLFRTTTTIIIDLSASRVNGARSIHNMHSCLSRRLPLEISFCWTSVAPSRRLHTARLFQ